MHFTIFDFFLNCLKRQEELNPLRSFKENLFNKSAGLLAINNPILKKYYSYSLRQSMLKEVRYFFNFFLKTLDMTQKTIYLDNHATTPVDPEVFAAMGPYFLEHFGNPASHTHPYGWAADLAVENARKSVALLINSKPKEIIFTGGATESNNLALLGFTFQSSRPHFITTAIEHQSILQPAEELKRQGVEVSYLMPDRFGQVTVEQVANALKPNTELVSIIWANNEIGSLNPISEIGRLCQSREVVLHTDAAQAVAKLDCDVQKLNVDLLSLSGHKIYGPKGVGALFIRSNHPRLKIKARTFGGEQERGLRAGTLNVPAIVGLAKACELFKKNGEKESQRLTQMRDQIIKALLNLNIAVKLNGHPTERLPNNLNFTFPACPPDQLINGLRPIAYSTGSACMSSSGETSHVLKAIGLTREEARSTIRLGLGRFTTQEEVDQAIAIISKTVKFSTDYGALSPK